MYAIYRSLCCMNTKSTYLQGLIYKMKHLDFINFLIVCNPLNLCCPYTQVKNKICDVMWRSSIYIVYI